MSVINSTYSVIQHQPLARYITQITLRASSAEGITYQAGQYIKVIQSGMSDAPLSIACAPTDSPVIELHLSHPPKNAQAQHILQQVQEEKRLLLRGPYGSCTASRFLPDQPILFFIRGTGFAPVKALLEAWAWQNENPRMHLFWCAMAADDFYLQDKIAQWQRHFKHFSYTPIVSRASEHEKLYEAVLAEYADLSAYQVYVSGPEAMVYAAGEAFVQHGLEKSRYYSDLFDYDVDA